MNAPRLSPLAGHGARQAQYVSILRGLTDTQPDIKAAVLATVDGLEIAIVEHQGRPHAAPLAAMASSLIALGRAAGREAGHEGCERVVVENSNGKLLVRPIEVGGRATLLLCMALTDDVMLRAALRTADDIARAVESL